MEGKDTVTPSLQNEEETAESRTSTNSRKRFSSDKEFESEIIEVKSVFLERSINPTPSRVASFLIGTKRFKDYNPYKHKLYSKYKGIYNKQYMTFLIQDFYYAHELNTKDENAFHINERPKESQPTTVKEKQQPEFIESSGNIPPQNGEAIDIISEATNFVNTLPIVKKTENQPKYVQKVRQSFPRAYEPWGEKENQLLR